MDSRHLREVLVWLSLSTAGCLVTPAEDLGAAYEEGGDDPFANPQGIDAAYPIILAHGFNASPIAQPGTLVRFGTFSDAVIAGLQDSGHTVYVAHVRPFATVAERAADLAAQVDEALKLAHDDADMAAGETTDGELRVPRGATRLTVTFQGPPDAELSITRAPDPSDPSDSAEPSTIPSESPADPCEKDRDQPDLRTCVYDAPGGLHLVRITTPTAGHVEIQARIESKVNIIAHSMGGLDARYYISALGGASRVASLTTISTPHAGSNVANTILAATGKVAEDLWTKLGAFLGGNDPQLGEPNLRGALEALHTDVAAAFNQQYGDGAFVQCLPEGASPEPGRPQCRAPWTTAENGVYYQSWAGVSSWLSAPGPKDNAVCRDAQGKKVLFRGGKTADFMDALIAFAGVIVADNHFIPNDGLVAVDSAKWGDFRGCVPADHIDEVGRGITGHPDFNVVNFYKSVAFGLSAHGY